MIFKSNTMNLHINNAVAFLKFKRLEEIPCINHAFSTRLGGISRDEFSSMNLSFTRGDSEDNVRENYKIFATFAGFDYNSLVSSQQDHNTNIRTVTKADCGVGIYKPHDMKSIDALITNDSDVTLVTHYADCTPIFLVDQVSKSIALIHAGWRGTVAKIAAKTLKAMQDNYNAKPENITAAIGPAISVCCFEVDKPVADEFSCLTELNTKEFIYDDENGKYHIDLLNCNKQILIKAGVKPENIVISDLCTKCCSDLLFSHRATLGKRGGMVAMMSLKG